MIAALLEYDLDDGRRWLSFSRPPPEPVRQALCAAGWRYHSGHRAWHTADVAAPIPNGITVGVGSGCHFATIRPLRGPAVLELLRRTRERIAAREGTPP